MLVGADTMTKALQDASTTDALGTALHVASVESLIAMKLHALRYVDEVRALKDQSDLLALLEVTRIAMDPECFRQLCDPYGHLTGMTESHDSKNKGAMSAVSLAPMEFPSGVSVVSTPPKIDLQEMIALSERYLPMLNAHPDFVEKKKRSVINVPFVL